MFVDDVGNPESTAGGCDAVLKQQGWGGVLRDQSLGFMGLSFCFGFEESVGFGV